MLVFYLLLSICVVATSVMPSVEDGISVRITTSPSQGPFKLQQSIQFFCEVEPTPADGVSYQWRAVEHVDLVYAYYSASFNRTYYFDSLRYCWYFCIVSKDGKIIGSAQKLVEVHGLLETDEPIARAFSLNERMALRINVTDYFFRAQYIGSLAWYHNGTKLTSDNRVSITNDATSLTISNMAESDAGKYEVRINSIVPPSNTSNSKLCDINILPVLENIAMYAPVTFLLQKSNPPTYNPEAIIVDYVLPAYQCTAQQSFTVDNIIKFNAAAIINTTITEDFRHRNGFPITDRNTYISTVSYGNTTTQSLRITYNNTDDILGHYVHQAYAPYFRVSGKICPRYAGYIYLNHFPIFMLYWNIRSSNNPILYLRQEKLVLTEGEINTLECDVINCIPSNISLWHNRKMLVQIHGTHLQHQVMPTLFGVFICKADNISNSSLVQEKAQIQLLLEAKESTCCGTARDLQISMAALLKTLCRDCDIDVNNLEETHLNYSPSRKSAYFTASLIYSNSEGTVTSNTLITRLWSWLLAQETPNITVSGYPIALSKKCPVPANSFTKETCVNQLFSSEQSATTVIVPASAGFVTGILIGAITGAILILLLLFCISRRRKNQAVANDKNLEEEDDMSINLTYGIEPHYTEPIPLRPMGKELLEHIYECPTQDSVH